MYWLLPERAEINALCLLTDKGRQLFFNFSHFNQKAVMTIGGRNLDKLRPFYLPSNKLLFIGWKQLGGLS